MQQIAEVAERNWFNYWPGEMKEEVGSQTDTVEVYEMMTGICEDEVDKLNLKGENVKTPEICPWKMKEKQHILI